MSMFKTLQHQPRVISLFTHNLENNKATEAILQLLRCDADSKYNVELDTKFPTLDQLKYMNGINSQLLQRQVPTLSQLLKQKPHDPVFHSELKDCVAKGIWNSKTPLWVDWEKKQMGNDTKGIASLLEPQEKSE